MTKSIGQEAHAGQDIRDVLERYFFALDTRDEALLASCFTGDATILYHVGSPAEVALRGREAIVRRLHGRTKDFTATTHARSNTVARVNGDTATADTHAVVHVLTGSHMRVRGIRYHDVLVRQADGWQIRERTHVPVWQHDAIGVPPFLP